MTLRDAVREEFCSTFDGAKCADGDAARRVMGAAVAAVVEAVLHDLARGERHRADATARQSELPSSRDQVVGQEAAE